MPVDDFICSHRLARWESNQNVGFSFDTIYRNLRKKKKKAKIDVIIIRINIYTFRQVKLLLTFDNDDGLLKEKEKKSREEHRKTVNISFSL